MPVYVDNFLNFPIGIIVPAGWYDSNKSAWIPSDNGKVIKILSIVNQLALLDVDGDGVTDTGSKLDALGITPDEQTQLAQLYPAGKSLWRTPVSHFTPWDFNYARYLLTNDAVGPNAGLPHSDNTPDTKDCCHVSGSIIEAQSLTLGEEIPIAGTPYKLHYRSDRVPGRNSTGSIEIPLSSANLPVDLKQIHLIIDIAGRRFSYDYDPLPNQSFTFKWDGKDAYGRRIQGVFIATIRIGYEYHALYLAPSNIERAFASVSSGKFSIKARQDITIWQVTEIALTGLPAKPAVGSWSLSPLHNYDAKPGVLFTGDGGKRSAANNNNVITSVFGTGQSGFIPSGAKVVNVNANTITAAPDGSLFIDERSYIRRIDTDGIVRTIAGNGVAGHSGDGGPASLASIWKTGDTALAQDGSLYFPEYGHYIRRIDPNGVISTGAGIGSPGFSGDGGPATQARLSQPSDVAVGADGSLYIADFSNGRVRRVDPNGIISTVAGTSSYGALTGDGIPATRAQLVQPTSVALASDGSLYIAESHGHRIRRVTPDGIINTVAGTGSEGFSGDGAHAGQSRLSYPGDLSVAADDSLYFVDWGNRRIRKIGTDGIITTVAGNGQTGYSGDGGPATRASFNGNDIDLSPKGDLLLADFSNYRIRKVASLFNGADAGEAVIASESNNALYYFTAAGKHLKTTDAKTGADLYLFGYNSAGNIDRITDRDGDSTVIEWQGGSPSAIVAPDGQRTVLSVNPEGYLSSVTAPDSGRHQLTYYPGGLLKIFEDPKGQADQFTYDNTGRLKQNRNAALGGWDLERTEQGQDYEVAMTTAEGRLSRFAVTPLATGDRRQTNTTADGTVNSVIYRNNGTESSTRADGSLITVSKGPDPRFGMQSPIITAASIKQPSGLTLVLTGSRSVMLSDPNDLSGLTQLTDSVGLNGNTTVSVFDKAALRTTETTPMGRVRTTWVNPQHRPVRSSIAGVEAVNYHYDTRGRIDSLSQGQNTDTRTVSYRYYDHTDAATGALTGYLETVTDTQNRTTRYTYDAAGRTLSKTLPDGRVIGFAYDANGNLTGIAPPARPEHRFSHTTVDLPERYTPPDIQGIAQPYTHTLYNKDKQPVQIQRPDGQPIDFIYNTQTGKLKSLNTPDGATAYAYLPATGQLDTITTPVGDSLSYRYDGSLTTGVSWSGAITGSIDIDYNNDFNITTVRVNEADPVTYAYDKDGLITQAGAMTIARNPENGLLTGTALGTVTDVIGYNTFGEIKDVQTHAGADQIAHWIYQRDTLGRITQRQETLGGISDTYDYAYDPTGRLIEVKHNGSIETVYGYDDNGNRTEVNGQHVADYDDQDRLNRYNDTHFSYTDNGELRTKQLGMAQDAPTTRYEYDVLGNLRHVELPDGTQIDYIIDGRQRRIGKKVDGVLVQGFLYQNQINPIAELDGNNQIISRFVYADKGNVPAYLVKIDPVTQTETTYRIISDHLGSPRLIVNTNDGNIAQQLKYDVFGTVTYDSNPGFQPFGFAGGIYDRVTKLVRFGARDYDAETGRWTAKDPIGFGGGDTNLYGYVLGDPVNAVDSLGLDIIVITGGVRDGSMNIFGHVGTAVQDFGMSSYGNSYDLGSSVNDYLNTQSLERNQQLTIIPTTPEQNALARDFIMKHSNKNGVGILDSCAVRTHQLLNAAGVPTVGIPFPGGTARDVATIPGAKTYFIPQGGPIPLPVINALPKYIRH